MAKNWNVAEAVDAILQNDKNGIADFGKRFPQATNVLTRIAAMSTDGGSALKEFAGALPERLTMRKIDSVLKEGVEPVEDDEIETDEDEDEAPAPKKAKRAAKSDEEKKAAAKARREARKAKKAKEVEPEDEDEEEETEGKYDGMNAVDLFKLCKKRGIKAAPKMKAAEYVKLLEAADAKVAEAEDDEEEWEDEPVVEKPKAKRGRPAKKKAEPEPEEEAEDEDDDDDNDWDI